MRKKLLGRGMRVIAGAVLALTITQVEAEARQRTATSNHHGGFSRVSSRGSHGWRPSWHRSALQCVPFARENSGIELSGNAGTWWDNATGLYERGARPEVGSILNFRATGRMRMGHVAVVTNVISSRHIEIDHANWGAPGRVSRNIDVVDVSPENDWTAVRVALNQAEDYGSSYPTYGFIYDRPDHGIMVANSSRLPVPALRSEPIQLRSMDDGAIEEVAEASDDGEAMPRYSGRHRSARYGRNYPSHASAGTHRRGEPSASTYRVSTRGTAAAKAHQGSKRHL